MKSAKPIILLEDDIVDVMTVRRALREIHVSNELIVFSNGEEALAHFANPDIETPCLVLLDLNMPRVSGIEFLKGLRSEPRFNKIPIVVLTSSDERQDVDQSYFLGISGYMVKPMDYQKFVEMIRTIDLYWTLCEMP